MSYLYRPAATVLIAALAFSAGFHLSAAREPGTISATALFSASATVMDEPITYPCGAAAKVTGAVITIPPGTETGWHTHAVPLAAYMLEGQLTVDYGGRGKRTYKAGDAFAEANGTAHNGSNTGDVPVKIFAVYAGAEGIANSAPAAAPK